MAESGTRDLSITRPKMKSRNRKKNNAIMKLQHHCKLKSQQLSPASSHYIYQARYKVLLN